MKTQEKKYLLNITSGLHAGAKHLIPEGKRICVGSNPEACDIVLFDENVAPEHFEIIVEHEYLKCRGFAPGINAGGKSLAHNQEYIFSIETPIMLGSTSLLIAPTKTPTPIINRKSFSITKSLSAIFALSFIISTAWVYIHPTAFNQNKDILKHKKTLEQTLSDLEIAAKVRIEEGRLFVDGIVNSDNEKNTLEREISKLSPMPRLQIKFGHEIANRIANDFRLIGHEVSTEYRKDGVVIVTGYSGSIDESNRLIANIGQDFPPLRDIKVIRNTSHEPKNAEIPKSQDSYFDSDAASELAINSKRVVAVIASPNPHVIMNDGSHYYPGAVFKNGNVLQSINSNGITLSPKTENLN